MRLTNKKDGAYELFDTISSPFIREKIPKKFNVVYNSQKFQSDTSKKCGEFCVYVGAPLIAMFFEEKGAVTI